MNKILSTTMLVMFAIMFVTCNKEKEIVIKNTANPNYNIGIWTEKVKNKEYVHIDNMYSLWPDEVGEIKQDSLIPAKLKVFIVSKDSIVLSEIMERSYVNNEPHLKVFDKEINLNPYLRGISCEYIRFFAPYSYNDLVFYTLNIIGKGTDKKNYTQPLTLMINLKTKEGTVVGRGHYVDVSNSQNISIFDDKYFGFLDFYIDSYEYIVKYYDKGGNYVGWSPKIGLEYTQTGKKVIYTSPLKNINKDWQFAYGNDKYGRPVSMRKGQESYDVKYSNSGYHITGYNNRGQKKYDFESYDANDLFDLRTWDRKFKNNGKLTTYDTRLTSIVKDNEKYEAEYTTKGYRLKGYDDKGRIKFEYENNYNSNFDLEYWDLKIPKRGKLIKYSYDWNGTLSSIKYYNANQTYYLREDQNIDGSFYCVGIYENSGEFMDDILIEVDFLSGLFEYTLYRNDPKTGRKSKIAELPESRIKKWLLDYLYNLN